MHILLLEIPLLLRGILEDAIRAHGGCTLLSSVGTGWTSPSGPAVPPDIVILGLDHADDAALSCALLARWPQAGVVALMPAGRGAVMYELRVRRKGLGEVSPAELFETLGNELRRKRARRRPRGADALTP